MNNTVGWILFLLGAAGCTGIAAWYGWDVYKYFKEKKNGRDSKETTA